jgi:hypothetical protein
MTIHLDPKIRLHDFKTLGRAITSYEDLNLVVKHLFVKDYQNDERVQYPQAAPFFRQS